MADYIVEGGRFIGACRQLLDHHFKLSWYDRFLPNLDAPPRPTGLVASEGSPQAPSVLTPPPALVAGHEFEPHFRELIANPQTLGVTPLAEGEESKVVRVRGSRELHAWLRTQGAVKLGEHLEAAMVAEKKKGQKR